MVKPLTQKLRRDISRQKTQFLAIAVTVFLGITMLELPTTRSRT